MTKTDAQTGLVTRNCSPVKKDSATCEKDVHNNDLCYCFEDLCNSSNKLTNNIWFVLGLWSLILIF